MQEDIQASEVANKYARGLSWLLRQRNRDGSWGAGFDERVVYTPHAVTLFLDAGLDPSHPIVADGVRWLKQKLDRSHQHWFGRLPALLKAKEFSWLVGSQDIPLFLDKLETDEFDFSGFFWHVLPITIALETYRAELCKAGLTRTAPTASITVKLMKKYQRSIDAAAITVRGKPNHTGLAAVFLHTIDPIGNASTIKAMVNWILADYSDEDDGDIHWGNSIGVSAYVLIDLALLGELQTIPTHNAVPRALSFFKQNSNGAMKRDRFTRSFDTMLHETQLYTTLLAMRAIVATYGHDRTFVTTGLFRSVEAFMQEGHIRRACRCCRRHFHIVVWAATGLLICMGLATLAIMQAKQDWIVGAITTVIGTGLGALVGVMFPPRPR